MNSQPDVDIDDIVLKAISERDDHRIVANRGGNFEKNVATAVGLTGFPHREVSQAVFRLTKAGRLNKTETVDGRQGFGSLPDPTDMSSPVTIFSVAS